MKRIFERTWALVVYSFAFWFLQRLWGMEIMVSVGFGIMLFWAVYKHK